jgi:hypothetical protein
MMTHIVVSVNMGLSGSKKVAIYVDGYKQPSKAISLLSTPTDLALTTFPLASVLQKNRFKGGTTLNYKVSSYDDSGESAATRNVKLLVSSSSLSGVLLSWGNVPEAKGFYVYKSINALNIFNKASFLSDLSNPFFGQTTSSSINFKDDGTIPVSLGSPNSKPAYSTYQAGSSSFYDGSDLKVSIGGYPQANKNQKTYAEGKIYKFSFYEKSLDSHQVLYSYVRGSRDFKNNKANYNFSISAGASGGGSIGGY